jgi:hypothetical protein
MLVWHRRLWLIDHGAALYFHHKEDGFSERSRDPFRMIKDHTLLRFADTLQDMDLKMTEALTPAVIGDVVNQIPDAWLAGEALRGGGGLRRDDYLEFLLRRLESPRTFLKEAIDARSLRL